MFQPFVPIGRALGKPLPSGQVGIAAYAYCTTRHPTYSTKPPPWRQHAKNQGKIRSKEMSQLNGCPSYERGESALAPTHITCTVRRNGIADVKTAHHQSHATESLSRYRHYCFTKMLTDMSEAVNQIPAHHVLALPHKPTNSTGYQDCALPQCSNAFHLRISIVGVQDNVINDARNLLLVVAKGENVVVHLPAYLYQALEISRRCTFIPAEPEHARDDGRQAACTYHEGKEKAMLCSIPRNADCSMQGAVHDLAAVLRVNRVGDMSSVQIPSSKYGTRVSRDYVQPGNPPLGFSIAPKLFAPSWKLLGSLTVTREHHVGI
ncbi:hypothetical protein COCC4DRAFT_123482 [Bipolaris maydis ATCC 48331]|uniref:Uncharacterized protein n=2 Tax=Cochliobolus heterostrophus TaxID=5016 RepID=M2UPL2_COCH5|nr:uncharacterized protein COCC4DRAFT_123482 [Bipolaris maydis ATCC 48331]EMD95531.1 hypothetical protein COCHEDRAFT_1026397 [Bipolaris maydis C5]ENI10395.1 hypothetical protein COCC4DRAFT_123482 [Bipolaris maydis ATCC 48331]KAJ6213654.1 hypothetical protein PSV09DRAFT_1026397 [Bipolaris maydis]